MCEPSTLLPLNVVPRARAGSGAGAGEPVGPRCGKAARPGAGYSPSLGSVSRQCSDRLDTEVLWLCTCASTIPEGP